MNCERGIIITRNDGVQDDGRREEGEEVCAHGNPLGSHCFGDCWDSCSFQVP